MISQLFLKSRVVATLLISACFATSFPARAETTISDQDLVYLASYGKTKAGQLFIQIRQTENGYLVTSTTKPSKLAGLLVKEHSTEARFGWRDGKLVPENAVEALKGKDSYDRGYTFDYENMTISLAEGKSSTFSEEDQFESVTYPLLLMHREIESIEGLEVKEVGPKRLRDYTYAKPEAETIKVPAGEFSTWKVTRYRTDKPEDTVATWLDQSDNPVPVKIVVTKDGKPSTLDLSSN